MYPDIASIIHRVRIHMRIQSIDVNKSVIYIDDPVM